MAQESELEKNLARYARENGIWTRKFSSPANAGVPDRIFTYMGQTLFLEIKAKGKLPTALQWDEIDQLVKQVIPATYVDNYTDGKHFLDLLLKQDPVTLFTETISFNDNALGTS